MARKAKNDETTEFAVNEVDGKEVAEKATRRRQSPKVRLQFALNNIINAVENNESTDIAVDAGKQLLEDLGFGVRPSTTVTAGRIHEAMLGLDIMDDLTPRKMKQLGQLLGRAQRGDDVTNEDISEIIGEELASDDDNEEVDGGDNEVGKAGVQSPSDDE